MVKHRNYGTHYKSEMPSIIFTSIHYPGKNKAGSSELLTGWRDRSTYKKLRKKVLIYKDRIIMAAITPNGTSLLKKIALSLRPERIVLQLANLHIIFAPVLNGRHADNFFE